MGFWETPMHKNAKWNADVKSNHRHDAADFITGRGSKWNGDKRHQNVDRRIEARQDKRAMRKAAAKAEGSSLCAAILLASAIGAAGLASNIAKAKGWA
jgi:hypothetical protein